MVDLAFTCNNHLFLIGSEKSPAEVTIQEIDITQEAMSMHTSVEWCMLAFQALFPHVTDCTLFEYRGQHKLTIKMKVLLYNLHARRIDINQFLHVYIPQLSVDIMGSTLFEL